MTALHQPDSVTIAPFVTPTLTSTSSPTIFSIVSKWILLNSGMKRFFERAYGVLVLGATFVLEVHPRNSHIKAHKLLHPLRAIHPPMKR